MSAYYNDIDPYCCRVLRKNIANGNLSGGVVDERDIRDVRATDLVGYQHIHFFAGIGGFPLGFKWANFPESIRTITGGFPCQDISTAGSRVGIGGSRSGLWREMYRLICEVRPDFVIVENVSNLLNRGIERVLGDLAACRYDAEWQCIPAVAIGAPHRRDRIFIVAYPSSVRCNDRGDHWQRGLLQENGQRDAQKVYQDGQELQSQPGETCQIVADTDGIQWNRGGSARGRRHELTNSGQDVAYSQRERCNGVTNTTAGDDDHRQASGWQESTGRIEQCSEDVSYSDRQSLAVGQVFGNYAAEELTAFKRGCSTGAGQWATEPRILRVADGVPSRVDRIKGLGNSVVPQLAAYVALCIMTAIEREEVSA